MSVSVISVVVTLAVTVFGAPQNGYNYPNADEPFSLTAQEAKLTEQILSAETVSGLLQEQEALEFREEELATISDNQESANELSHDDHHPDHDHHHDHHHDHQLGLDWLREAVPGEPGVDYPIYWQAPQTAFNCRRHSGGYYADMDTGCQVFHVCNERGDRTFLCPNGTIFNQQHFTCQWWFNVDCLSAQEYYGLNVNIGVVAEETQSPLAVKGVSQVQEAEQALLDDLFVSVNEVQTAREDTGEDLQAILTYEAGDQPGSPPQVVQQEDFSVNVIPSITQTEDESTGLDVDSVESTFQGFSRNSPVQDEINFGSVQQETMFDEEITNFPIPSDSELYNPQQENDNSSFGQDSDYVSVQKEIDYVPIQQETDNVLVQQETDYVPIQQDTGYAPIQQETEYVPIQQEPDYVPIQQEIEYAPIEHETKDAPFQQEISTHIQNTDFVSMEITTDITSTQEEPEYIPIEQKPGFTPAQGEANGKKDEPEDNSLSVQQDGGAFQQETEYAFVQQETEDAIVPKEPDFLLAQQGNVQEISDDIQQENIFTDSNAVQQYDDIITIQEESDVIPVQVDTFAFQQEREPIPQNQETEPITFQLETSAFTEREEKYDSLPQQETVFAPMEQTTDQFLFQEVTEEIPVQLDTDILHFQPEEYSVFEKQEINLASEQHDGAIVLHQQEYESPYENQQSASTQPGDSSIFIIQQRNSVSDQSENGNSNEQEERKDSIPEQLPLNYFSIQQETAPEDSDASQYIQNTDFISVIEKTDPTSLNPEYVTYPIQQENEYITTSPKSEPSEQNSDVNFDQQKINFIPMQENIDMIPIQQVTVQGATISPVMQDSDVPIQQETIVFHPQQEGHISVQVETEYDTPVTEELDHVTTQQLLEHSLSEQQTENANGQYDDSLSVDQESTVVPLQTEEPQVYTNLLTAVFPEQNDDYILPANEEANINHDLQFTGYTVDQQSVSTVSVQQADHTIHQENVDDVIHHDTNFLPVQSTDNNEIYQEETDNTYAPVAQPEQFIQENPERLPVHHEVPHDFSQDSALFPVPQIPIDIPAQNEPLIVVTQNEKDYSSTFLGESSNQNGFEFSEHSTEPLLPVVGNGETTEEFHESLPEVMPEAESTFEVPSSVIPEISVLYGVPLIHSLPSYKENFPFEPLSASEVSVEVDGGADLIAPGVANVNAEGLTASQELNDSPTTFPTLSIRNEGNEIIPSHIKNAEGNPDVKSETKVPDEVSADQQPILFPETVVVKQNQISEETNVLDTHLEELIHAENYDTTSIIPELIEEERSEELSQFETTIAPETLYVELTHHSLDQSGRVGGGANLKDTEDDQTEPVTEFPSRDQTIISVDLDDETYVTESFYNNQERTFDMELFREIDEADTLAYIESTTISITEEDFSDQFINTASSIIEDEFITDSPLRSEILSNVKNTNNTVNETGHNRKESDVSPVTQSSLLDEINSTEGDDAKEAITTMTPIEEYILLTAPKDPVLSLVYKTSVGTSNGIRNEEPFTEPSVEEGASTDIPRQDEDTTLHTITSDELYAFERSLELSKAPPNVQEFVILPAAIEEEENKVQVNGNDDSIINFPPLVDLDQLFGIPHEKKFEIENIQQPFEFFQIPEVPSSLYQTPRKTEPRVPQTLYEAPVEHLPFPPSNLYLPPF